MNETDFMPKEDSWLKKRENGLILSDYQIAVLKRVGINYEKYATITSILIDINDILEEDDDEELEGVAKEIDEQNYYSSMKN